MIEFKPGQIIKNKYFGLFIITKVYDREEKGLSGNTIVNYKLIRGLEEDWHDIRDKYGNVYFTADSIVARDSTLISSNEKLCNILYGSKT